MKKIVLCVLLSLSLLAGCAPAAPVEDDGRVQIVATVFPAYDFARAVAGDRAEVTLLLPPGVESHSYEPTPSDILAVQNCDLFLFLGGESDAWVDTILTATEPQGDILRMVDCVELLEEAHVEGMQLQPGHDHEGHSHGEDEACDVYEGELHETPHDHEELHDHEASHDHAEHHEQEEAHDEEHTSQRLGAVTGMDEHVWTSPRNAAEITLAIGDALAALDEANAAGYQANAAAYARQLNGLDQQFEDFFNGCESRTIVFGDRFPLLYFAERYGLDYYAAFPGCGTQTEPSAATVAFLTDKVKQERIPAIWYIEFSNHLVADCIAEATEKQTAMFHTCHNVTREEMEAGATYVSLMTQNLKTLEEYFR